MDSNQGIEGASTSVRFLNQQILDQERCGFLESLDQKDELSDENESCLNHGGWSREELFKFYKALKLYGADIKRLTAAVPEKTEAEVEEKLNYYQKQALSVRKEASKNFKVFNTKSSYPLAAWAQTLINNVDLKDLQTDIPNALRLIADLEHYPPLEQTNNYDFKAVYLTIANAMEGKAVHADVNTLNLIETCLVESAHCSKVFLSPTDLKQSLDNIDFNAKGTGVTTRKDDCSPSSLIRHLASQKNYNPLSIPEKFLKPDLDLIKLSGNNYARKSDKY